MKTILYLTFAVSLTNLTYSQNKTLTGQVVDENFKPLINAIVTTNIDGQATRTNNEGFFQFAITPEITEIQVQYVGLHTKIVKIKNKCYINVIMFDDVLIEWKSIKQEDKYYQKELRKLRKKYKEAINNGVLKKEKECE